MLSIAQEQHGNLQADSQRSAMTQDEKQWRLAILRQQQSTSKAGKLKDRAGNEFILSGVVPAGGQRLFVMAANTKPLNNAGDDMLLLDPQGYLRHRVTHSALDAQSGTIDENAPS
jgi:hypothetical protein